MRIQEGHFLKSAFNLDLTLSDDGECRTFLIRPGSIDLGAFCVELWPKQVSYRISVPMSYISCSRLKCKLFRKYHFGSQKCKLSFLRPHAIFQYFSVNHVFECLIDGFRSWEGRNRHRMDLL